MVEQRKYDGRASGFTLLELLIVITIMGMIMVALTGGVRFAGRAWESQERIIAGQGDSDAVENVLRQIIASGRSFEGDASSMRFIGTLPRALARSGLFDLELKTSDDRLVLDWKPHFKGPSVAADPTETELAKNISGVEFAYFFAADQNQGGWQRVAKDKEKSPSVIAIAVQSGDGRHWPPLTVAPMIETAAK